MAERPLRWVITGYKHGWLGNDLYIKVQVNPPTKLYLHHSIIPPRKHAVATPIRGTSRLHWPNFCFEEFDTIRNSECTDVAENSFIIPGWTLGQKRWWLFSGTRGGAVTQSISCICSATAFEVDEAERPKLPGDVDLLHREMWAGAVGSQPSHVFDSWDVLRPTWFVDNWPPDFLSMFFVPSVIWRGMNRLFLRRGPLRVVSGRVQTRFIARIYSGIVSVYFFVPLPLGAVELTNNYRVSLNVGGGIEIVKERVGFPSVLLGSSVGWRWIEPTRFIDVDVRWVLRGDGLHISGVLEPPGMEPIRLSVVDTDPWFLSEPFLRVCIESIFGDWYRVGSLGETIISGVEGPWNPPCPKT